MLRPLAITSRGGSQPPARCRRSACFQGAGLLLVVDDAGSVIRSRWLCVQLRKAVVEGADVAVTWINRFAESSELPWLTSLPGATRTPTRAMPSSRIRRRNVTYARHKHTPHVDPTEWRRPESRPVTPNTPRRRVMAEVQSRICSVPPELNHTRSAMSSSTLPAHSTNETASQQIEHRRVRRASRSPGTQASSSPRRSSWACLTSSQTLLGNPDRLRDTRDLAAAAYEPCSENPPSTIGGTRHDEDHAFRNASRRIGSALAGGRASGRRATLPLARETRRLVRPLDVTIGDRPRWKMTLLLAVVAFSDLNAEAAVAPPTTSPGCRLGREAAEIGGRGPLLLSGNREATEGRVRGVRRLVAIARRHLRASFERPCGIGAVTPDLPQRVPLGERNRALRLGSARRSLRRRTSRAPRVGLKTKGIVQTSMLRTVRSPCSRRG